jgi:hypothetical protein
MRSIVRTIKVERKAAVDPSVQLDSEHDITIEREQADIRNGGFFLSSSFFYVCIAWCQVPLDENICTKKIEWKCFRK